MVVPIMTTSSQKENSGYSDIGAYVGTKSTTKLLQTEVKGK